MSSGPAGLDVREYGYGVFSFDAPDGGFHNFTTHGAWLVTRIQAFMPAGAAGQINLGGQVVTIDVEGCVCLEPNGAYRGPVGYQGGANGKLIVEYWYQGTPTGLTPEPEET